jgi:uncharacterized membrane protein (DUF2068 family)
MLSTVVKYDIRGRFDNVQGAESLSHIAAMSDIATKERQAARRRLHRAGLRTVAFVEALKGALALVGAYVFIRMLRRDVDFGEAAEHVLFFFHISTKHRLSQQFLDVAGKVSNTSIAMVTSIAVAYATLRFLEGYGLWRQRVWAEWLAIVSGCLYLPFEIYKLVRHPNELHWVVLGINILVVVYIAWVRWDEIKEGRRPTARGGYSVPMDGSELKDI